MSGIQFKALPQFPAQVLGIPPIVVTKSGLTYTLSYNALVASLSVVQVKQQLNVLGLFNTVNAAIPVSVTSNVNQAWNSGGFTQIGGPLLTFIFTTISYNAAQQATFNAAAAVLPY